MQKVVDIKFLRFGYYKDHSNSSNNIANALNLLEKQILEYLEDGWVMKGEIAFASIPDQFSYQYLIQTMVKYETMKEAELIEF